MMEENNQVEKQEQEEQLAEVTLRDGVSEPNIVGTTGQEPTMQVQIGTKDATGAVIPAAAADVAQGIACGTSESNNLLLKSRENNKSSSSGQGTASGKGSNLNVYLRHNPPSRTGKNLEPVKLATSTGLQQIIQLQQKEDENGVNASKSNQNFAASQTLDDGLLMAKHEHRISNVLNQDEFQHLGYQMATDYQVATETSHGEIKAGSQQKMYQLQVKDEVQGVGALEVKGQAASQSPTAAQNFALPQYGIVDPSKKQMLVQDCANPAMPQQPQNMQQLMANLKDPDQLAKLMKEINPANGRKIISPPVGLIIQSEDQQLFELYQMQSQELMRIANEGLAINTPPLQQVSVGVSPNTVTFSANKNGGSPKGGDDTSVEIPTQEQAQQIAMPELKFNDDPIFGETIRMGAGEKTAAMTFGMIAGGPGKASMTQHEHHEILEPKLRSDKDISRFIDQPTLSQQTISGPEMAGIEKSNQVIKQPSLQKITLPAFSGANFGKSAQQEQEDYIQTGTFKEKVIKNAIFSNFGSVYHQRKDQMILGMMDSGDDLQIDSANSPLIIGSPKLHQNSGQQVQWVKVPRPQQPALVEKNAIGGGGKYTITSRTPNNAVTAAEIERRANQPTFPAFFTKTAKNQQKRTTEQQINGGGSVSQMKQMNNQKKSAMADAYDNKDGRLTSNDIMHVDYSRQEYIVTSVQNQQKYATEYSTNGATVKRHNGQQQRRRNTTIEPLSSTTVGAASSTIQQNDKFEGSSAAGGVFGGKKVTAYRPIRVQSVLAPYQESFEDYQGGLAASGNGQSPAFMSSQLKAAGQSNYKVSYLNKPSAVLHSTSSANSSKFVAAAQKAAHTQQQTAVSISVVQETANSQKSNNQMPNTAAYGATINQDSKMSFKDYIDLQSLQAMEQKFVQGPIQNHKNDRKNKHAVTINEYQHSKKTASVENSPRNSNDRNFIDSRHPSLNNTFVPRLQALKPKKMLENTSGFNQQAINLNQQGSMKKMRRMTILEDVKAGNASNRTRNIMNKTFNHLPNGRENDDTKIMRKPQHRLRSLNQTSRTQFVPKNPINKSPALTKQSAQISHLTIGEQNHINNEVMMARGINKFTGRSSPPFGPDSTLEVVVVKQHQTNDESQGSATNLIIQQQQSKTNYQTPNKKAVEATSISEHQAAIAAVGVNPQQTMHFGGKFQVNIHKRSSTHTITESQALLNNHSQSKEVLLRKKSQLSTVTAQAAPVITPKYFATIQAITANERKQIMKNPSNQLRGSSPIGPAEVNTALQRSFAADETTNSAIGNLAKNSSDAQTPMDHHQQPNNAINTYQIQQQLQQTPQKQNILYQTQQQISPVQTTKEQLVPSTVGAGTNMKTLMSVTANQNIFRRENVSLGSDQSHQSQSQSPWRRKKNKLGQPPILTAEHIVHQNISPYEKSAAASKQRSIDQKKLQQANAQGIVLGLPKKLSDAGARNSHTDNSHFLPELGQRRQSGLNVLVAQDSAQPSDQKLPARVDIELRTRNQVTEQVMNADLVEKVPCGREEIDSILSPEYLRLVNNQSELRTPAEPLDGPITAVDTSAGVVGENTGTNQKQERRQVIKILDQSKWRQTVASPTGLDQQNSLTNMGESHLLPITPILGGGKTQTASTADQKKRKTAEANKSSTNKASSKQNSKRQDLSQVLQEGSLHMGSVFDHNQGGADSRLSMSKIGSGPNSNFQKTKGRKSQLTQNQDLRIQGKGTSLNMMQDQIEESEREMKEIIARDNLMQDDLAGNSSIDHPNFDQNVPVGISAIFSQNQEATNFMNQTEYSQFIKNNDITEAGNSTKQDFNGQIQASEYDHLYQTMGNLQNLHNSSGQLEMTTIPERMHQTKNQNGQRPFLSPNQYKKIIQMHIQEQQLQERHKYPLLKFDPRKGRNEALQGNGSNNSTQMMNVNHNKHSMILPIEKLKLQLNAQKQIAAMQKGRLNANFFDSQKIFHNSTTRHQKNYSSILSSTAAAVQDYNNDGSTQDISRNGIKKMSLTQTRFSQHQRALSELRSIQRQIHLDGLEQSPPMPRGSPKAFKGSKLPNKETVSHILSVKKSPSKERTISPRKQKQIAEREQRLEKLKQAEAQRKAAAGGKDEVRNVDVKSERDLASTQMGKHTPMDDLASVVDQLQQSAAKVVGAQKQQPVIVNTSGANTAYLPSPKNMNSPITSANAQFRQVNRTIGPPFAAQQTKSLRPKIFEKSVLPEDRIYHYNARGGQVHHHHHSKDGSAVNKDIIDACPPVQGEDYAHERAGSSIIANYQKQSQLDVDQDNSPKSYKMPANFPHGVDSQVESIQGGAPDSASAGLHNTVSGATHDAIGVSKKDRMPVHSFTNAQQEIVGRHDRSFNKIQSSKINHRRHILAEKNATKTGSKLKENFIGQVVRGESIELAQTLRMKKPNQQDINAGDILPLSFEDSVDPMPERYEVENDSIQNINQVQDLLDIVEKEKQKNNNAGFETVNNSSQNGNEVGQGSIDFEVIQANIAAAAAIDPSERETPDIQKAILDRPQVEKSMLISSAQTLEAELTSPPDQTLQNAINFQNQQAVIATLVEK